MKIKLFIGVIIIFSLFSCDKNQNEEILDCCICDENSYIKSYTTMLSQSKNGKVIAITSDSAIQYDALIMTISDKTLNGGPYNCDYGKLKKIILTCYQDYNVDFSKNDTLNEMIQISDYFDKELLSQFLKNENRNIARGYQFYLNQAPSKSGVYDFKISVQAQDGRIFNTDAKSIYLEGSQK